jgi:hypothetical protein
MSALRQTAGQTSTEGGVFPGDVQGALEELDVPAYAVDKFGVIRWTNSAAHKLVGDVRLERGLIHDLRPIDEKALTSLGGPS